RPHLRCTALVGAAATLALVLVSGRVGGATAQNQTRLGITLLENGGVGIKVNSIFPNAPATRCAGSKILKWQRRGDIAWLAPGDLILFANNQPIRSRDDFFRVLSTIEERGRLELAGLDASDRLQTPFHAVAQLDEIGNPGGFERSSPTPDMTTIRRTLRER